jgi:uncharacterized sulfatase
MRKPNILVIFTDQQRYDTIQPDITPNLLNIAEKGVNFTNTFTCQPVCGPARSCLQTGQYATETGCYRNGIALPESTPTIADSLRNVGYYTAYIGKWHLASTILPSNEDIGERVDYQTKPIPPERRGGYKDYWLASDLLEFTSQPFKGHLFDNQGKKVGFEGYRVECLTDFALKFLENQTDNQPFFLFLSYLEPHHQNNLERFVSPKNSQERYANHEIPEDLKPLEGDWKENYPDYLGCCSSIDMNVGRIYDKLEELDILEDTLLIFLSDHGCHFKTRNWEYKRSCHDASIHIPLIIHGPGFSGGEEINELVSLIDVPPTILEIGGQSKLSQMRGKLLQNLINASTSDWRSEVFIQISESQVGRAIRTNRWKYSVRAPHKSGFLFSKSQTYKEDFLYDLKKDPNEQNNLVNDPTYADVRAELAAILKKRMKKAGEEIPEIIPV